MSVGPYGDLAVYRSLPASELAGYFQPSQLRRD